ncbi:Phage protein [Brevibacillus sp. IT-7CA2]
MTKTNELIELLKEHPDRELIFMYPDECSDHMYTLGSPSTILIDEYVSIDERVWLKYADEGELFDDVADNVADDLYTQFPLSEEQEAEVNKQAAERIKQMDWKKAIVVYIQAHH